MKKFLKFAGSQPNLLRIRLSPPRKLNFPVRPVETSIHPLSIDLLEGQVPPLKSRKTPTNSRLHVTIRLIFRFLNWQYFLSNPIHNFINFVILIVNDVFSDRSVSRATWPFLPSASPVATGACGVISLTN